MVNRLGGIKMSHQNAQSEDDWLDVAKERLEAWGAEERRQRRQGGYGSETIDYVVMRYGGRAPMGTGTKKEPERPEIVEADEIISAMHKLGRDGEKKRTALYVYYVFRRSYGGGAKMLHCSRSHFQNLVESGQDVLAGGLMMRGMHSAGKARRGAA